MASCKTCVFFRADTGVLAEIQGSCLRYAPRPQISSLGTLWPQVGVDNWCGEWEPATVPAPPGDREG